MLAMTGPLPAGAGWAYEFKWDGVRALADISPAAVRSTCTPAPAWRSPPRTRNWSPCAEQVDDALLDGEVVLLGAAGQPSFTALAERMHVRDRAKAARLAAAAPVTYMIFDLLRLRGEDLTGWPYRERRAALESLGLGAARWAVPPAFADGPATYEAAGEHGLEGVMAKRVDSVYRPGVRSPDWVKVKLEVTGDFVVGGWRPGARKIGGLLVGVPGPDGRLDLPGPGRRRDRRGPGTGAAAPSWSRCAPAESPFAGDVPREDARGAIWVTPQVVVEVKYGQRTPDGRLRFPRVLRLRPDKPPEEVDDAG